MCTDDGNRSHVNKRVDALDDLTTPVRRGASRRDATSSPHRRARAPGNRAMSRWVALAVALAACGSSAAAPVAPAEPAPLPPLSATPITLLVEHKLDLGLTVEQVGTLDGIGRDLAATNRPWETELATLERDTARTKQANTNGGGGGPSGSGRMGGGRGGGGMGGGGGGGGMGGGGGGGGMGGGGGRGGKAGTRSGGDATPEMREQFRERREKAQQLHAKISDATAAALATALCGLAVEQRDRARPLLEDAGYELPAAMSCAVSPPPGGAEPSASPPPAAAARDVP